MINRVLIVEDDPLNMKLLRDILESCGHWVAGTCRGLTALGMICDHPWDLIVLDIRLPDICGLDIARMVKDDVARRHIPILAVTARAMLGDREQILAAGCDAYISKPISVTGFINQVDDVMRAAKRRGCLGNRAVEESC